MSDTMKVELPVSVGFPEINRVGMWSAFGWLKSGLADLHRTWLLSTAHGVLFAGLGWMLVNFAWAPDSHFALTLTSGFLMLAPLLAICFYDMSRCLERGEPVVSLTRPFRLLRNNPWTLSMFVILLAMLFSMWERINAITLAFTLKADIVAHGSFSYWQTIAADPRHLSVVIGFFAVGALFALIAFVLSAVSLPLIVDRPVDIVTAIVTSVRAVLRNPLAMLVWAGSIASLILLGYLTNFIGLIVIFPLLGHATWHAYRQLVAPGYGE